MHEGTHDVHAHAHFVRLQRLRHVGFDLRVQLLLLTSPNGLLRAHLQAAARSTVRHAGPGRASCPLHRCKGLRIVTCAISGGRSLTRPSRHARRFPSAGIVARAHMYMYAASVWDLSKDHFLSPRPKPSNDSQLYHRCAPLRRAIRTVTHPQLPRLSSRHTPAQCQRD
jgi:hypothetical protein